MIEPGNNFLAGCGFLGEVSCDGIREVGLFWRDALGWPLVWDQDDETAVQSPRGGTKVSWGGPPVAPKTGRNRQRLDLAAPDLAVEVDRLVALGATELGDRDDGVELADPDDNEFLISPGWNGLGARSLAGASRTAPVRNYWRPFGGAVPRSWRKPRRLFYRTSVKNAVSSSTKRDGCSIAAKWPPRGGSFQ